MPDDRNVVTVSIGGRTLTRVRFAAYSDGIAGMLAQWQQLVGRLDNAAHHYGMEISRRSRRIIQLQFPPLLFLPIQKSDFTIVNYT